MVVHSLHSVNGKITVTPSNPDPYNYVNVELTNDPRNINAVYNNEWSLYQDWNDSLNDWYAISTLCQKFDNH